MAAIPGDHAAKRKNVPSKEVIGGETGAASWPFTALCPGREAGPEPRSIKVDAVSTMTQRR